jgi:hypothetical protein
MPVLVRNLAKGPSVFTDEPSKTAIEWAGAGDPNGEDVQPVPDAIVKDNVNFSRSLVRGIFSVEEAPGELKAAIDAQAEGYKKRQAADEEEAEGTISREEETPVAVAQIDEKGATVYTEQATHEVREGQGSIANATEVEQTPVIIDPPQKG